MLSFEAAKGRWSLLSDLLYLDLSNSDRKASVPGVGLEIGAETGLKALITELAFGYSLFKNQNGNFDLLAGVRYAGVESSIDLAISEPLPAGWGSKKFSAKVDYIDPIVGFRGKLLLGQNWFIPYYFDIGGFTVDSDLTLQAYTAIGYRVTDWFSMSLGYRYLYYDFGDSKLLENLSVYGPVLGLVVHF